ncbi:hypothetical protein Pmar_PMAR016054 [Perkinsus marinus ATCC 50983]|uniref:Uncharacterized protein n=1 Tax=Perkinsus marinus (strain ATCC 50983 / TXsc) TaxID=423536 RepID=C5LYX6_PERM5|nr:hypothetical protein Pmar_PMAR016054 [Perkinsus marinus ATCC 50983]EEQ97985.1 hypothetical protein Pmar_PMAR016054 [Perkinsus marinus ATCC 50983]|eukprot:XP_002765268.1 hypothetical protein Pmar_PMAR016054 [Perkinsus marinus ATCC 50983]
MPGGTPSSTAAAEVAVLRGKIHSMEQEMQSLRTQRDSVRTIQVENERLKNQIASLIETASKERAQALELQRAALATGDELRIDALWWSWPPSRASGPSGVLRHIEPAVHTCWSFASGAVLSSAVESALLRRQ